MTEDLKARVSYLRGYTEGLDLGEESKEQKILHRIIGLLDDITDEIEQLRVDYEELYEYTVAIDDDLTDIEDDYYEDEDREEDDYNDQFEDQENGFSIECPNCREIVVVDENILDQDSSIEITCPGCGEAVLVDDEEWDDDFEELAEIDEDEGEKED